MLSYALTIASIVYSRGTQGSQVRVSPFYRHRSSLLSQGAFPTNRSIHHPGSPKSSKKFTYVFPEIDRVAERPIPRLSV